MSAAAVLALAVLICLAPVLIGCALFDVTKPFFERGVGTAVSLILMQVCGLIVMQLVLMSDQWFMAQAVTQSFNQMAASAQGSSSAGATGETLPDNVWVGDVVLRRDGGDVERARTRLLNRWRDHDARAAHSPCMECAPGTGRTWVISDSPWTVVNTPGPDGHPR